MPDLEREKGESSSPAPGNEVQQAGVGLFSQNCLPGGWKMVGECQVTLLVQRHAVCIA